MDQERRGNLFIGILLILVGGWFLAGQFFPEVAQLINVQFSWPWWIIGAGAAFLLFSVLGRTPALAVPASIIAGIGGILLYQNNTGDWASWAYAWALIPGFAGVGSMLMNFLQGRFGAGLREGLSAVLFSLLIFAVFGSFMGGPRILGQFWPVLLIIGGFWLLLGGRVNWD
ncbi:MAG: hypothetical protein KIT46_05730 [Anaerolineales bacterium]|nr:hypothetical protein [Anaerolineales bacterium]MCW5855533.1 hypothetical protein [Anaerolineales bacterium]